MSYNYQPAWQSAGEYKERVLHRGNYPVRRDTIVIEKGQKLLMGSVLGRKTATGKAVLCAKTSADGTPVADGSEKAAYILQIDVDATASDRKGQIFRTGAFLGLDLTLGSGHTIESVTEDLAFRGIFIEKGED